MTDSRNQWGKWAEDKGLLLHIDEDTEAKINAAAENVAKFFGKDMKLSIGDLGAALAEKPAEATAMKSYFEESLPNQLAGSHGSPHSRQAQATAASAVTMRKSIKRFRDSDR